MVGLVVVAQTTAEIGIKTRGEIRWVCVLERATRAPTSRVFGWFVKQCAPVKGIQVGNFVCGKRANDPNSRSCTQCERYKSVNWDYYTLESSRNPSAYATDLKQPSTGARGPQD